MCLSVCVQVEGKKSQITGLESQVDELKKRSSNQLDEISRLEDQLRGMNVEHTAAHAKIEQLQTNVSIWTTSVITYMEIKVKL